MIGQLRDLTLNRDGTQNITVTVRADFREEFDRLKDQELNVEIKRYRRKRSLDANAMCWALCSDIGRAMSPPLPKEEVYRRAIRDVGEYVPLPIREDAVETFTERWAHNGTGWFTDIIGSSKLEGYKLVFAYYGSSTYDTKQMSVLLDHLVDDAQQIGITIPLGKAELERLKGEWK